MLVVENIEKSIGGKNIISPVSFEVKQGEFVTVLGPNGAGKSTLFKLLSLATQPTKGKIFINGKQASSLSSDLRKEIGVISHHTFLYDNLSALENLRFYGQAYQVSNIEKRIKEVLRYVGLQMYTYDAVRTYSRGMQQRLAIARAILHNPAILFLDEPYTGLDQHAIQILNEVLESLHKDNRTLFMITHNYEDALALSNRLLVIAKGRIVYDADTTGIKSEEFRKIYLKLVGSEERRV
ncbi:ABC transporter ATP-binding protein [Desulfuribacillus alkaliarsenatis]|uniref:Sodium ABC transporter ATP-binding protein n=1 Tax=Desulfuribacillus alkaliarsenatis TaxID=766136 RepID=A0A1E5FZU6_9FIRM|nr:ABC transporter ATP-binding protein [Desulfuribacillus alkaliarsenatis]OEF96092.1 sodium ABC transporter ATP-binding protein [Desulfuribacillus alkaliarsenatis]